MIQTIKDLVSAKADTTVALAREIWAAPSFPMRKPSPPLPSSPP